MLFYTKYWAYCYCMYCELNLTNGAVVKCFNTLLLFLPSQQSLGSILKNDSLWFLRFSVLDLKIITSLLGFIDFWWGNHVSKKLLNIPEAVTWNFSKGVRIFSHTLATPKEISRNFKNLSKDFLKIFHFPHIFPTKIKFEILMTISIINYASAHMLSPKLIK